MEAAAGRGGSLPIPSTQHPPRKGWREYSSSNGGEEPERFNYGQSDERTIYEVQEGTGSLDVDFRSITIGSAVLNDESLQQRLQEISKQREELQHLEVELRAQAFARSEVMEMQNSYRSQIREHVDAATNLKDQLQEREEEIHELELKLEEKDRELHAVKIDTEVVWAKEDLLREQNIKLVTFRRERDNSDAERAQLLKQIHDLQEHIREKESQFLALEEQHRVAQETVLYKDEQLREAQAWITRVQEVDALQSTTNHSLQSELRDRTEQFNQYWIALQRQFLDMERHHVQIIQHLQFELAEARGRNGVFKDDSHITHDNSDDSSLKLENKGSLINAKDDSRSNNTVNLESSGKVLTSNSSTEAEHVAGAPIIPSVLGMNSFHPAVQIAGLHPVIIHPQGVPQSVASTSSIIPVHHLGHIHSTSAMPSEQHSQNQQLEPNSLKSDSHYGCELSSDGKTYIEHLNNHVTQHQVSAPAINGSNQEIQDQNKKSIVIESHEKDLKSSQPYSDSIVAVNNAASHTVGSNNATESSNTVLIYPEIFVPTILESSSLATNKAMECTLFDERALLAFIVRAIPARPDDRIKIRTTLLSRLGKMLAPLHWRDYEKHYGKLDDFISRHPELFVIEGDFIHLRYGAQEIISATAAVAKVATASATSAPYSSLFPSVAVTPISQSNRHKKAPLDTRTVNSIALSDNTAVNNTGGSGDRSSQILKNQTPNGICFGIVQGISDINNSNRTDFSHNLNDLASEMKPAQSTVSYTIGNGSIRGLANRRPAYGGKQQERDSAAGVAFRR